MRQTGEKDMKTQTIAAIVLLVVGGLGLAYGGFSYTKDNHKADIGALHLSIAEKQYVNVPVWAGVGAMAVGGLLLVTRKRA
jgi:TRAP-type C4-dicarboxylate transport system permease small subunit